MPTSLINLGAAVGTGIAAPGIVHVIGAWSWHAAFGLLGVVGLLWCAVWLAVAREGPLAAEGAFLMSKGEAPQPYRRLLCSPTVIGVQIAGFSVYWLVTLVIVWLPAFLREGFGYTPAETGWILTLLALCVIIVVPGVSILSEGLKRRGASSRVARG